MRTIIKEMTEGEVYDQKFLLSDVSRAVSSRGTDYVKIRLADESGSIPAYIWEARPDLEKGSIVTACMSLKRFNDAIQGNITKIKTVDNPTDEDFQGLIPVSPFSKESLLERLNVLIDSIEDEDYRNLVTNLLAANESWYNIPAAKSNHHAFLRGLLQHSVEVAEAAAAFANIYPFANKSAVISSAILHDIGKVKEFDCDSLGLVTNYSTIGNTEGHLLIGADMVRDMALHLGISDAKIMPIRHIILSHHGKREWGAVQLPCSVEAQIVFISDYSSARCEAFRSVYDGMESGTMSSEYIKMLDGVKAWKSF